MKIHTREAANDYIKNVKSRTYERHADVRTFSRNTRNFIRWVLARILAFWIRNFTFLCLCEKFDLHNMITLSNLWLQKFRFTFFCAWEEVLRTLFTNLKSLVFNNVCEVYLEKNEQQKKKKFQERKQKK